jgi:hypothetical protein
MKNSQQLDREAAALTARPLSIAGAIVNATAKPAATDGANGGRKLPHENAPPTDRAGAKRRRQDLERPP